MVSLENMARFWRNRFIDERVRFIQATSDTEYEAAIAEAEDAANKAEDAFVAAMERLGLTNPPAAGKEG